MTSVCSPINGGWQSNVDIPTRRTMIHKLLWVFQHKQQAMNRLFSGVQQELPQMDSRLPSLVRRLELALYLRAASLEEYLNEQSLQRRVQHLIVSLHHQAAIHIRSQEIPFHIPSLKRSFIHDDKDEIHGKKKQKVYDDTPCAIFLLDNQEEVLRHVFSYLDGPDVVRCMGINRFTARFLPSNVRYLDLSWSQLSVVLATNRLQHYDNLERLHVSPITSSQGTSNELMIRHLATILPCSLQRLSLSNTYTHTDDINATLAICTALATRCTKLSHLYLSGNAIGDSGMSLVASLLPHLRAMEHVDLRRNYIGEGGFKALATALSTPGQSLPLHTLLLGSNIAAHAIPSLVDGVGNHRLKKLKVLGLEDNFIDLKGIEALANVLQHGVCPSLQELCIGDNIVENQMIQTIFAFAIPSRQQ